MSSFIALFSTHSLEWPPFLYGKWIMSKYWVWNVSGLVKLQNDVRTCEYEDVHILWDMLKRNEIDLARTRNRRGRLWKFQWTKCSPLLCRGFWFLCRYVTSVVCWRNEHPLFIIEAMWLRRLFQYSACVLLAYLM